MNTHWQCTKVDYHVMVRDVPRCTLCGASVEKVTVPYSYDDNYYTTFEIQDLLRTLDEE